MTIAFTSMSIPKPGVAQSQGLDEKPKFSFGLKPLTKFVALIGAAQNNMRDAVVDNSGLKYSLPKESYETFDYTPPVSRISDTVSAMSKQVRVGQVGADTPATHVCWIGGAIGLETLKKVEVGGTQSTSRLVSYTTPAVPLRHLVKQANNLDVELKSQLTLKLDSIRELQDNMRTHEIYDRASGVVELSLISPVLFPDTEIKATLAAGYDEKRGSSVSTGLSFRIQKDSMRLGLSSSLEDQNPEFRAFDLGFELGSTTTGTNLEADIARFTIPKGFEL